MESVEISGSTINLRPRYQLVPIETVKQLIKKLNSNIQFEKTKEEDVLVFKKTMYWPAKIFIKKHNETHYQIKCNNEQKGWQWNLN